MKIFDPEKGFDAFRKLFFLINTKKKNVFNLTPAACLLLCWHFYPLTTHRATVDHKIFFGMFYIVSLKNCNTFRGDWRYLYNYMYVLCIPSPCVY